MRSNAGRRTRLRAPRQQEYEAQSWRKWCHSMQLHSHVFLALGETRNAACARPELGQAGADWDTTLAAGDTVVGWRGREARRVIVEPVNLSQQPARHSQGPQAATIARVRAVRPEPAIFNKAARVQAALYVCHVPANATYSHHHAAPQTSPRTTPVLWEFQRL